MYNFTLDNKYNPIIITPVMDNVETNALLGKSIFQLNQIYRQIPKPSCNRCGNCCDGTKTGNPWLYSIEYLNIIKFLNQASNKSLKLRILGAAMMYKSMFKKKIEEDSSSNSHKGTPYMLNCPALDFQTNLCPIYEYRPFVCRVYGLKNWSKEPQGWLKHEENIRCNQIQISKDNQVEHWNKDIYNSLSNQLKQLASHYHLDKTANAQLNNKQMVYWLSLKLSAP